MRGHGDASSVLPDSLILYLPFFFSFHYLLLRFISFLQKLLGSSKAGMFIKHEMSRNFSVSLPAVWLRRSFLIPGFEP